MTVNLTLMQPKGPTASEVLKVILKSPEARKVAIVLEASGISITWFVMAICPAFNLNGHLQSIPNLANSGGQTEGLKLVGKSV